jgi:phospholipid/cholesterol/gamma-HCH transport system substrate-binding protein
MRQDTMNDQAIRFRIGIFMLAGLILLALLVFMFGGFPKYFKKADSFTILFDYAPGIGIGSPVRRSGIKIGEVASVKLDNETGEVRALIHVEPEVSLRKADKPTLVQGFLGGDSAIEFIPPADPKQAEPGFVPPGSTLRGVVQADAMVLLQKTTDLMPQAQEALIEIRRAFQRLDKAGPGLEQAMTDLGMLARASREAIPELRKTNDEIRELVKTAKSVIPDFKRTGDEIAATARTLGKIGERLDVFFQNNEAKLTKALDSVQLALNRLGDTLSDENQKNITVTLRNLRTGTERLDILTKDADDFFKDGRTAMKSLNDAALRADETLNNLQKTTKPLGERGPAIMKNLEDSTAELSRVMADLRDLLQAIGRSEGTVQKLLADPALYNNLNDAAAMTTRIMPRLDRILRDVEIFADRIARHPETLGLGGVIRPSSGLKESPTIIPHYHRAPPVSIIDP